MENLLNYIRLISYGWDGAGIMVFRHIIVGIGCALFACVLLAVCTGFFNRKWWKNHGGCLLVCGFLVGSWITLTGITQAVAENLRDDEEAELLRRANGVILDWFFLKKVFQDAGDEDEMNLWRRLCQSFYDFQDEKRMISISVYDRSKLQPPRPQPSFLEDLCRNRNIEEGARKFAENKDKICKVIKSTIAKQQRRDHLPVFREISKVRPFYGAFLLELLCCCICCIYSYIDIKEIEPKPIKAIIKTTALG